MKPNNEGKVRVERQVRREDLAYLADQMKGNGEMLMKWLAGNANPPGINLYALGEWLLNCSRIISPPSA